jgi:hypothetical protein
MASHLHSITFDAIDPYSQALWWSEVLAVPMSPDDFPGDPGRCCGPTTATCSSSRYPKPRR